MPAHKAPFFSISKLMSMNHRLIGKSVPIPELLFWYSPCSALSEGHSNKSSLADGSWQGPAGFTKPMLISSTDWSPLCSVAMLRKQTQTAWDTAPQHTPECTHTRPRAASSWCLCPFIHFMIRSYQCLHQHNQTRFLMAHAMNNCHCSLTFIRWHLLSHTESCQMY